MFWEIIKKDKPPYEAEIKRLLQETARSDHDYTRRKGILEEATLTDGSLDVGDEIRLYINTEKATYAKYIIEPEYYDDPFIDDALRRLKPQITDLIVDLYEQAIIKFNAINFEV